MSRRIGVGINGIVIESKNCRHVDCRVLNRAVKKVTSLATFLGFMIQGNINQTKAIYINFRSSPSGPICLEVRF